MKGMKAEIKDVSEITDIDKNGRFIRAKKVRFTVNGSEHTLRISMVDFDQGKMRDLVKAEADKIIAAYGSLK